MRLVFVFGFAITIGLLVSCSTETGVEVQPVKSTFSSINSLVIQQRCAKSGCHLDTVNPIMEDSKVYSNLVGKINVAGVVNYIEPGQPDKSYLFQKILPNGTRSGMRMPRDGAMTGYLSAAVIDSIQAWIVNGAQNN